MTIQGGLSGIAQWSRYQFTTFAGQNKVVGVDDKGFILSYDPLGLVVYYNGRELSPDDYTAVDGSSIVFSRGLKADDIVRVWSIPTFNVANTYTQADADVRFSRRRNRLIDPGMRYSQEQGNTLITLANGVIVYPCDGVACVRAGSTGGAQVQRIQSITPNGSGNRLRFTITAANPTPGAGDLLTATFPIEGQEITDFRFGSAGAKLTLYRVTLRMPVACKLNFALRNGYSSVSRSYIGTLEILPGEAGLDVTKYIVVFGDTAGAWNTDNNIGASITLGFQVGTTFQGVPNWQAGNFLGLAANSNMMATTGWSFDVMDYGWTDASDITNPTPPRFELRSPTEDLRDCQRYWCKTYPQGVLPGTIDRFNGPLAKITEVSSNFANFIWEYPIEMRSTPTISAYSPDTGAAGYLRDVNSNVDRAAIPNFIGAKRTEIFANNVNIPSGSNIIVHAIANGRMI